MIDTCKLYKVGLHSKTGAANAAPVTLLSYSTSLYACS